MVFIENNVSYKLVGFGTIRIKMFDRVVRTFINVRHVSELKKNLISLCTLESIFCSFKAEGGTLGVCKGTLIVMKGKKTSGLYSLQGSTVTSATTLSLMSDSKVTRLWHMWLRHISEKELSK